MTFVAWGAFAAFCTWGFAPAVDLAAHGAQLETLANLVRGDPALSQLYEVKFPLGYGLVYWLFLPVALVTSGATAVRLALWLTLMLFPVSTLALARTFKRPDWIVLLGLPLAFNLSYWYGLLSGVFAQPLAFLTLAAFARALDAPSPRRIAWVNVLAAATFLSHLVAFAAMGVALAAMALCRRPLRRSVLIGAAGLGLPVLLSLSKVWSMATRAVTPGPWPATEYALLSHVNWFFKNYRPEGKLAAVGPLLVTAAFALGWLRRRKVEPREPAAMFLALLALYLVTPKTLSGIFLVSVRLPVLAGMLSLLLVSPAELPRPVRAALVAVSLASLVETAVFHWRFARLMDGLDELIARVEAPGRHGYVSTAGNMALGSKHPYLEHMGQWLTATRGGVGHHFFADAEHHPVRFREGVDLPTDLAQATPEQMARLERVLVFGDGPLPSTLQGWRETARAKQWRLFEPR